jgi:hypothetical protein
MFPLMFYQPSCVRLAQTIADFRNHLEYDHGDSPTDGFSNASTAAVINDFGNRQQVSGVFRLN